MMMAHDNDLSLVSISWTATSAFVVLSVYSFKDAKQMSMSSSLLIFALLAMVIACACCAFALVTNVAPWQIPVLLWQRFFYDTYIRLCLLLFWLLCSLASLLFIVIVHRDFLIDHHRVGTVHRKFFHLTASLVTVSGLFYDPPLLALCVHLMLQIFIIFEVLRSRHVQPLCRLDNWLLLFVDGRQDSPELIMTPILLLLGLNLPILLDFRVFFMRPSAAYTVWTLKQWHFAGLISVGIGDSAAALIGSKFGRIRWPSFYNIMAGCTSQSRLTATENARLKQSSAISPPHQRNTNAKTAEGSLAMFTAQLVAVELLMLVSAGGSSMHPWHNDGFCCSVSTILAPVIAAFIASLVEAQLDRFDNVLVPFCSMLTYWLLE